MSQFRRLNLAQVPITLITGTLPLRMASYIMEECGVRGGSDRYNLIRVQTNRPEHLYAILRPPKTDFLTAVKSFIYRATNELRGTNRGVIFTRYKNTANDLGEELGVGVITADVKEERDRKKIMDDWKNGCSTGWIIGTKSLIQGVDYPDVRYVLFVDSPFGMIDFVQGAGRGGRNGETCRVVLFSESAVNPRDPDISCAQEMNLWTQTAETVCLRQSISEHMDGKIVTCASLSGAQQCHHCLPDAKIRELDLTPYDDEVGRLTSKSLQPFEEPIPTHTGLLDMPQVAPRNQRPTVILGTAADLERRGKREEAMGRCIEFLVLYHQKLPASKCLACYDLGFNNHTQKCFTQQAGPLTAFYRFNKPNASSVSASCAPLGLVGSTHVPSSRPHGVTTRRSIRSTGVLLARCRRLPTTIRGIHTTVSKHAHGTRPCSKLHGSWPMTRAGSKT
jgi:hypothetical protein